MITPMLASRARQEAARPLSAAAGVRRGFCFAILISFETHINFNHS